MDFVKILRNKKLKATPQRIAILQELNKNGHSCIDDIFTSIKKRIPSISLATVYKNIIALHNYEVIKSIKLPNQKQKYEINIKPHIHLFCNNCKKIEDFYIDTTKFKYQCEQKSGYTNIDNASIILKGICNLCNQKNKY